MIQPENGQQQKLERVRRDLQQRNGQRAVPQEAEDPDFLYSKSRQEFGSWDIKDVVRDSSEDQQLANLDTRDEGYSGSLSRERRTRSRSSRSLESRKNREQTAEEEDVDDADDRNNLVAREIETCRVDGGSPDRRIKAMIERLKSREEKQIRSRKNLSPARKQQCDRLNDRVLGTALQIDLEETKNRESDFGASDRKSRTDKRSEGRSHGRRSRESEKTPRDGSSRRHRNPEDSPENFDVRIERYERAPQTGPRRDPPELHARCTSRDRNSHQFPKKTSVEPSSASRRDSLKNRDISPEKIHLKSPEVDVIRVSLRHGDMESSRSNNYKNHAKPGSRVSFREVEEAEQDSGAGRKHSFKSGDGEVTRVSFKIVQENGEGHGRRRSSKDQNDEVELGRVSEKYGNGRQAGPRGKGREEWRSDRHSRPLTPPYENISNYSKNKSWHESNKVFASKYLQENSKITREMSPIGYPEVPVGEQQHEEADGRRVTSRVNVDDEESNSNILTSERNGSTIIRIRASPEERRCRPSQEVVPVLGRRSSLQDENVVDEEEEEERAGNDRTRNPGRSAGLAPSRRLWNYREGGVLITDVEDGQPCLQCGETCPGFSAHTWRKNCTSCKCPRNAHDVCHEEWVSVRSRLGLKGDEANGSLGSDPRDRGFAWAPPGLPPHKVDKYFSLLPETLVPRLGTEGERYRDRQLTYQLPKQDLAKKYCRHLEAKHAASADDFMAARNEIALDIGSVQETPDRDQKCGACVEPLESGSLVVSASKLGLMYHPACFRCTKCQEILVDLAYCVHDDMLYCERHYAEQLKPRCAACDELIFSGEYTKAMNKEWHSGHFCCWQCDESLTGQRYVLRDEHPYCIKCYESVFANGCEECNKIIGIDSKDLSYKDKHWHEACFLCNRCRVSLVDKQFGSKVDKIYCGNCYDAQFASRCDGCGEIFRAGTKKMEYKTRQWHEKCFCCVVCKNPFGTNSFIPREQEIYCTGCYEDKFATRCVKCNQVITSNGVTYKNAPWHKDCFTCVHCNQSLAGKRFTSRDEKPYCADCFAELFAKRCISCSKPITGIGGTRFISFQDRHWHNDCFICAGCKTSLVGRGFITDGEDIICPECAKQKLM
ncbi:uncharacterized protein [Prorops nasuta]